MKFDDIVVRLNILDAMKHPSKNHYVFCVEILDDIVDGHVFKSQNMHAKKIPIVV